MEIVVLFLVVALILLYAIFEPRIDITHYKGKRQIYFWYNEIKNGVVVDRVYIKLK